METALDKRRRELERLLEPSQNDYLSAFIERISPIKGKASFCIQSWSSHGYKGDGDGYENGTRDGDGFSDCDEKGDGYGYDISFDAEFYDLDLEGPGLFFEYEKGCGDYGQLNGDGDGCSLLC